MGYLTYLHVRETRSRNAFYKTQVTKFIENMKKLDVHETEIIKILLSYQHINELIKANKTLEKSLKKYNL